MEDFLAVRYLIDMTPVVLLIETVYTFFYYVNKYCLLLIIML